MVLTTDDQGLRVTPNPNGNHFRILFLGDSFTMGYGVNDTEVFPYLVQQKLKEKNIIVKSLNYGIGNSGNGRNLLIVKNKIKEINPDLIIMQFTSNDMQDNKNERMFSIENEQLKFLGVPKDRFSKYIAIFEALPFLNNSFLISFLKENRHVLKGIFKSKDKKKKVVTKNKTSDSHKLTYSIIETTLDEIQKETIPLFGISSGDFKETTIENIKGLFSMRKLTFIEGLRKVYLLNYFMKSIVIGIKMDMTKWQI